MRILKKDIKNWLSNEKKIYYIEGEDKMLKKIIATTLMLTLILSNISTIYANPSTVLDNYDDMESYVVFGEEYSIYSNTLKDGSIEKKVINPDGTCESYKFIDNVLYDINGKVIATFHEEVINYGNNYNEALSKEQLMSVMSYYESEDGSAIINWTEILRSCTI